MVDLNSATDIPPSMLDMLRMFLTASNRGEHVSLLLESRRKTLSSKYWSINPLAGTPAETNAHTNTKTKNPARVRRSRLRQEEFFRKKHDLAKASGDQKSADHVPNQATGNQELSDQMENQLTTQPADGVPQLDGMADHDEEPSSEEVFFSFACYYSEEDVQEGLKELVEENPVLSSATLVSRVLDNPRTADHLCTVVLILPAKSQFTWPEMPGFPDFYKDVKRL